MAEEPGAEDIQLLRRHKIELIEILSADADFVLQHADSRFLISVQGYQQVKACHVPSKKVTDLLDHIIQRGPKMARGLLEMLKDEALQKTFPMLHFVMDLQVNKHSSEKGNGKKKSTSDFQESSPSTKICVRGPCLVKEKQLMTVARAIGSSWREIGRLALDIPSEKLEQIEEDHRLHVERVFAMLRYWRNCQREKATAAHLHTLLNQEDWALPQEKIACLLKTD